MPCPRASSFSTQAVTWLILRCVCIFIKPRCLLFSSALARRSAHLSFLKSLSSRHLIMSQISLLIYALMPARFNWLPNPYLTRVSQSWAGEDSFGNSCSPWPLLPQSVIPAWNWRLLPLGWSCNSPDVQGILKGHLILPSRLWHWGRWTTGKTTIRSAVAGSFHTCVLSMFLGYCKEMGLNWDSSCLFRPWQQPARSSSGYSPSEEQFFRLAILQYMPPR